MLHVTNNDKKLNTVEIVFEEAVFTLLQISNKKSAEGKEKETCYDNKEVFNEKTEITKYGQEGAECTSLISLGAQCCDIRRHISYKIDWNCNSPNIEYSKRSSLPVVMSHGWLDK